VFFTNPREIPEISIWNNRVPLTEKEITMTHLLIHEPPLQVLPTLAKAVGLNQAIFLQQLHYWLLKEGKKYEGLTWVYNTFEQWRVQFPFWTTRTIQNIVKRLRDSGLISTRNFNHSKMDRTLWYTINYDKLKELESRILHDHHEKCSSSRLRKIFIKDTKVVRDARENLSSCINKETETTNRDNKTETTAENRGDNCPGDSCHRVDMCVTPPCPEPAEDRSSLSNSDPMVNIQSRKSGNPRCPHEAIIALYHGILPMCPKVKIWDEPRRKLLRARWRESCQRQSLEWWRSFFQLVGDSDFLTGRRTEFIADLEWLVRPSNFGKILNGRYHNREHQTLLSHTGWATARALWEWEYERGRKVGE